MRTVHTSFLALLLLCVPLAAVGGSSARDDAARQYADCMGLAPVEPRKALALAKGWRLRGGGAPSRHCGAVALLELGHYEEAARRLEDIAEDGGDPRAIRLRPTLLGQAANAWLLAGETERALKALNRALGIRPDDADLLVDRGVTLSELRRYRAAVADFDRALTVAPGRAEAFVFRATARRALAELVRAEKDANSALDIDPGNTPALLELGIILRLRGDTPGARRAFRKAAANGADADAAEIAHRHLADMEGRR